MKVVITGGYGALAYYVTNRLIKGGHQVVSYDFRETYEFLEPYIDNVPQPTSILADDPDGLLALFTCNPDRILHMAEAPFSDIAMAPYFMDTNVTFTSRLLLESAKKAIPCTVITWSELIPNIYGKSIFFRESIAKYFNIGNGVVSTLSIPRILSYHNDENAFGNVVRRFYNSIAGNELAYANDDELGKAKYAIIDDVVDCIYEVIQLRSRGDKYFPKNKKYNFTHKIIANHILHKMQTRSVILRTNKEEEVFNEPRPIEGNNNARAGEYINWLIDQWSGSTSST